MPPLKNSVKIISWKPNITQGRRVMDVTLTTLERDHSDAILDVKLEHVAAVVEGLIAVGRPHDTVGRNYAAKNGQWDSKIAILLLLSINGVAECISDLSRIRLGCKRRGVASSHRNAAFNFVVRAGQHRAFGHALTVAAPADIDNEKTKRPKTQ